MIDRTLFLHSDYLSNIAAIFGSQMILRDHLFFLISFIIFGLSFLIQVFYYLYYYLAPAMFRHPDAPARKDPVSVIICARNEELNLRDFLPAVLQQDYPGYEVIVVNDCSEDDSYNVLGEYLKKYPHLKISNIIKDPKFTHNKKFAQFIGIKASKNEILLFTDADCKPESEKWLERMASRFTDKTDFVLGYGGYFSRKGLLNRYIRYDSMVIAVQYLGMAIKGIPYMGVGRNLAYRRSLFFEKKGFVNHTHLASGDDDLFVNSNASENNIAVEFRKESHTRSVPAQCIGEFFRQKKRHLTTANHYKLRDKVALIAEPATRVLFYVSFIILLANLYMWPFFLVVFGIRLIIQFTVFALNQKKLNEHGLLLYLQIFDILSPLINVVIYAGSLRQGTGKNRWK
jgi:cellulose synthase/poly-beta-1,6-N-acetylglucosamine synthase-like glycosyltransferase